MSLKPLTCAKFMLGFGYPIQSLKRKPYTFCVYSFFFNLDIIYNLGSCKVSYHTLRGPVQFLCAPEMPPVIKREEKKEKSPKSPTDESLRELSLPLPPPDLLEEEEVSDIPPKIPERSPIPKKGNHKVHKRTTSDGSLNK